ncbi:sensor histidine kinase [Pseudonocardia endophytica]|uniref:Histidine kinase n=1 Tax=Pseudonocardia endophytica TaxID=401976 RepID=A0A4R1HV93_PSEEN|nr:ATP-binding protein [Pseudonocardia endophytica]TCK25341.1 histidine kinase [Pseudonocardia endophytica]
MTTGSDERPAATLPLPNGLAYAVTALYVASALALLGSIAWSGASWGDALTAHQLHNVDLAAVLGVVILRRQPGHVIGWLLVAVGAFEWPLLLSRAYHFLDLPGGAAVEDRLSGLFVPATACLLIGIPQLFPDGRLLSRRWRPLAAFGLLASAYLTVLFLVVPPDLQLGDQPWPIELGFPLIGVTALASLVPAFLRFRRSRGGERQQFKWVIYGLAFSGVLLAVGSAQISDVGESLSNSVLTLVAQGIIPIAFAVAVLRYRLYDIDVVINKTVVFVALAAFITAVYAGIVVGLGRLLPIDSGDLGLSIAATAVVAVAFEPVRARVQHAANRLVYGRRATPYEALAAMTAHLGRAADPDTALAEAARLLAEGTGAARAAVWVARDGRLEPVGTAGGPGAGSVPLDGSALPRLPGADLVAPVHDEGRLVGALSLAKRPGEGVSTADRKLVGELAGQARLLLTNTRLRTRLRERLDELRASRRRLLAAQDGARHTLERDLHDGAQQEVVACKIRIGLARTIAAREGATELAERLERTAVVADRVVDTLRDVARGIYPPLLEAEGLGAALRAQTRRADLAVTVLDRGTGRASREIESTAYFCALEALQNTARHSGAAHAHVELDGGDATLTLTATDDGAGFDPDRTPRGDGLTTMLDRADAAGGTLAVESRPGHGTTITLVLPTAG